MYHNRLRPRPQSPVFVDLSSDPNPDPVPSTSRDNQDPVPSTSRYNSDPVPSTSRYNPMDWQGHAIGRGRRISVRNTSSNRNSGPLPSTSRFNSSNWQRRFHRELNWSNWNPSTSDANTDSDTEADADIDALYNRPPTPPNPAILSIMEQAPEPQVMRDFVDSEAYKDFTCIICTELISNHSSEHTCNFCRVCMCPNTCLRAYNLTLKPGEKFRPCPNCRKPLRCIERPESGPRSIKEWNKLKVYCGFPTCREIIDNEKFDSHTNTCPHNVKNCTRCSSKNWNQEIHSSYCMEELISNQAELKSKNEEIKKLTLENTLRKQITAGSETRIKELENKVIQLESARPHSDSMIPIPSTSNPMNSVNNPHGKYTKFTIKYLDKTFQINNLSLLESGAVLRQKIEETIGCKVGAILRLDHTLLDDTKFLRQHQYCFKPTVITVLPVDIPVNQKSKIKLNILGIEPSE